MQFLLIEYFTNNNSIFNSICHMECEATQIGIAVVDNLVVD